jgi:hypothetical protein
MICVSFVLYHQEAAYVQNAWRELPETGAGRRNILGVLRLTLIPLPAPARAKAARSGGPASRLARQSGDKIKIISRKKRSLRLQKFKLTHDQSV